MTSTFRYAPQKGSTQYRIDDFSSLSTALTAIGSTTAELIIDIEVSVTTNTSILSTTTVNIKPGGSFAISAGATLTINGPIEAGLYQIFSGSGTAYIAGARLVHILPQWFGATGDAVTDDTAAIQKALTAAINTSTKSARKVFFPTGRYLISSSLTIDHCFGLVIEGESAGITTFEWTGSYSQASPEPMFNVTSCQGVIFNKIAIACSASYRLAEGIRISTAVGYSIVSKANRIENCGFGGTTDEIEVCVRYSTGVDANNDFHSIRNTSFANYGNSAIVVDATATQAYGLFFDNILCVPYGWKTGTCSINGGATTLTHDGSITERHIGCRIEIDGAGGAGTMMRGVVASITDGTHCELTESAGTTVSGATYRYGPQYGVKCLAGDFQSVGGGTSNHLIADFYCGSSGWGRITIKNMNSETSRAFLVTAGPASTVKKSFLVEGCRISCDAVHADYPYTFDILYPGNLRIDHCSIGEDSTQNNKINYNIYEEYVGYSFSQFSFDNNLIHSATPLTSFFHSDSPTSIINTMGYGVGDTDLTYHGLVTPEIDLGSVSGRTLVPFYSARPVSLTLTASGHLTMSGLPIGVGNGNKLIVKHDGGPHAVTWEEAISWSAGSSEVPEAGPDGWDLYEFYYDGATIYGVRQ